jgi:hypothetical protein
MHQQGYRVGYEQACKLFNPKPKTKADQETCDKSANQNMPTVPRTQLYRLKMKDLSPGQIEDPSSRNGANRSD